MKPKNMQKDKRAIFAVKCMTAYTNTTVKLGVKQDMSVWLCLYPKESAYPAGEMNVALQRARLYKRVKDGQNWTVLFHPFSQIWMNEKEDTFKIVFKTGREVKFGLKEDNTPYIESI